ncbi:hypothetical protein BV898_07638 [Hypsibius exemplaris]|uniref:Otopetrin-2 n=1 Tax=Hypsibius exemplaris TaxID=2072580 RepID=A0A1W0WSQ9_HYPEX|nr:hypothetical protein BV898_07638 [Hypsibius exemplaris]
MDFCRRPSLTDHNGKITTQAVNVSALIDADNSSDNFPGATRTHASEKEKHHRTRSTTVDSGYEIEVAEFDDSPQKHHAYRFPPVEETAKVPQLPVSSPVTKTTIPEAGNCNNKGTTGTVDSSTIRRLSIVSQLQSEEVDNSPPTPVDLEGLSYGLRIRLSRGLLHETNRSSFANQVEQISLQQHCPSSYQSSGNPLLVMPMTGATQWAAEISQPLSALYAILVVITSACLAFSAQLTSNVDSMYCRYFDSVLLFIGIVFLMAAFGLLYRKKSSLNATTSSSFPQTRKNSTPMIRQESTESGTSSVSEGTGTFSGYFRHNHISLGGDSTTNGSPPPKYQRRPSQLGGPAAVSDLDSASFYLKMGALAFAIGSMIYACLELGVFVENTSCFNTIMGLNPVLFMVFVVLQLYFVFLNSQLTLKRYRTIGRFGLMHLVATNLCIWIRTLIDETLHAFGKIREKSEKMVFLGNNMTLVEIDEPTNGLAYQQIVLDSKQGKGGYNPLCVDDESVMKKMMEEASVFLYPCIIEYSMISAGIIYIMWTIVDQNPKSVHPHSPEGHHHHRSRKTSYAVDCDQAAKGLFVGIIIVVLTIVSLILYFIFLEKPAFTDMAVLQAQITEIILYGIGMVAVAYCFVKLTRNLKRSRNHNISTLLDETLLKFSMMGVYGYSVVSILGGFAEDNITGVLSVVAAALCLLQSTAQTVFIFDASQRVVHWTPLKDEKSEAAPVYIDKPARETVTLLLIVNFAMWATNVFCTLRAESSPSQNNFYGMHEWMVILHVTVPLVIFYRFHSTACLFEIWKRAYKVKRPHNHTPTSKAYPMSEYITTA